MLTFLFWNLANASLHDSVARLVSLHDVDIVVVAESRHPVSVLTGSLNGLVENGGVYLPAGISNCPRVQIVSRFGQDTWQALRESDYYSLRRLTLPARRELIFGALHLPSRSRQSPDSLTIEAVQVAQAVRSVEQNQTHENTVLVGDFNMNPFEAGMLSAAGFHAVSTRGVASRGRRRVLGTDFPFFYNPMWGHLGDRFPGPAGTYYYSQSEQVSQFWHVFDQFLVRPGLADLVVNDSIEILNHDGVTSLLTRTGKTHRTASTSDHLPLKFSIDL